MMEPNCYDRTSSVVKSVFTGESFDIGNVRTVYAGAPKDRVERNERVVMLFGPTGSGKSMLIDCICNYFYGARFGGVRYRIANERFDASTPVKSIIKYVFNNTTMPYRPVVIDTPEIAGKDGIPTEKEVAEMLHGFLLQSHHIKINAIALVLKFTDAQIPFNNEEQLKETIKLFPDGMLSNTIVLFSSTDERRDDIPPSIKILLRYLNLRQSKYYFFDGRCLCNWSNSTESEAENDAKKLIWNTTMSELDRFFYYVGHLDAQTISENNVPSDGSISNEIDQRFSVLRDDSVGEKTLESDLIVAEQQRERIIPIKLIDKEVFIDNRGKNLITQSTTLTFDPETSSTLRSSLIDSTIKRYTYDPKTMTHNEQIIKVFSDGQSKNDLAKNTTMKNTGLFALMKLLSTGTRETLINDIPSENMAIKRTPPASVIESASGAARNLPYGRIQGSPPPEYTTSQMRSQITPIQNKSRYRNVATKGTFIQPNERAELHFVQRSGQTIGQQDKTTQPNATSSNAETLINGFPESQPTANMSEKTTANIARRYQRDMRTASYDGRPKSAQIIPSDKHTEQSSGYLITTEMKKLGSPMGDRLTLSEKRRRSITYPEDEDITGKLVQTKALMESNGPIGAKPVAESSQPAPFAYQQIIKSQKAVISPTSAVTTFAPSVVYSSAQATFSAPVSCAKQADVGMKTENRYFDRSKATRSGTRKPKSYDIAAKRELKQQEYSTTSDDGNKNTVSKNNAQKEEEFNQTHYQTNTLIPSYAPALSSKTSGFQNFALEKPERCWSNEKSNYQLEYGAPQADQKKSGSILKKNNRYDGETEHLLVVASPLKHANEEADPPPYILALDVDSIAYTTPEVIDEQKTIDGRSRRPCDYIDICFLLLAPLFILFIVVAVIITIGVIDH